ncbi:MAG: OmpW family outer membrane protein [Massilia sp.]
MNQPFKTRYVTYLTALLLLIPLSAAAQDEAGFYASAYGGVPAAPSTSFSEFRPTGPGVGGTTKFGGGLGFGAAVGRRFGNGWAVELALDERGNYLRRVGGVEVDGNIFSELVLLNVYYRFPARGALRPFIGAGLGYVIALDIDVDRNGSEQEYSREGGVGVQAIVGVEYSQAPLWRLTGDARRTSVESGTFKESHDGNMLIGKPKYRPASLNFGVTYLF